MSKAMMERRLGDDDWQVTPVDGCLLDELERRALKVLADGLHGLMESTLVAHGVCAEIRASLIRRGLASAWSRMLISGDRTIELSWIAITDAGRRAIRRPGQCAP